MGPSLGSQQMYPCVLASLGSQQKCPRFGAILGSQQRCPWVNASLESQQRHHQVGASLVSKQRCLWVEECVRGLEAGNMRPEAEAEAVGVLAQWGEPRLWGAVIVPPNG